MTAISELRPSPIAGTWYSNDPDTLRRQVNGFLSDAEIPELEGEVVAVIAPHAGYRYSGGTAGYAFRCLRGMHPELVVVVSPMHSPSQSPLLTTAHCGYSSPLGPVWVGKDEIATLDELLRPTGLALSAVAYDNEHSLEIELPFLQCALDDDFKLLPVMMHTRSTEIARKLGEALANTLQDQSAVLVASSDLSHFYSETNAQALDQKMLRRIGDFDPDGVLRAEINGEAFACGAAPVAAVLWASQLLGADRVVILHHSTSGEQTGDHSSVVGYGAAAVLRSA
jgi:AmmeMemoRadiSam system protein B